MDAIAGLVVAVVAVVSVWAWSQAPGQRAAEQFTGIWQLAWGKQLFFDFFGLNLVLALWMLSDAQERGEWLAAILCVITMPVFGAISAGTYWLLRALG